MNETEFEAADVDVEDWIDGVSFLQATHKIYRNPAMFADYGPVLARMEELEQEIADLSATEDAGGEPERTLSGEESLTSSSSGDRALGEPAAEDPRLSEARAELERLTVQANKMWEQYAADVEVWRLRKLDEPELVAIRDELGDPPAEPRKLGKNAKPQAVTAYTRRFDAWVTAMQEHVARYNLHCLAKATMSVTVQGIDRGGVTVEQLERIRQRPGGPQHLAELVDVLQKLSTEGVEIIAPHRTGA